MVSMGCSHLEEMSKMGTDLPRTEFYKITQAPISLSESRDCWCMETEPILPEDRLFREGEEEEEGSPNAPHGMPREPLLAMTLQIVLPFLLAGFGTVSAGIVLDVVQVNVGKMDSTSEKWNLIIGNLALKQVQAAVVGFLAAVAAVILGWIPNGGFQLSHTVLLCSSSVATAFTASLLQGIIMVGVIVGSKRKGINPDNVATPIAASFGDLITLGILAWISKGLYSCLDSRPYVSGLVCVSLLSVTPLCVAIASRHPASRALLYSGWEPVITAMVISSIGGLILDHTISDPNLAGIVVYAPIMNGIGGNLVAIQSSRISTYLHFHSTPGEVPEEARGCYQPWRTFCGTGVNQRSAQVLLLLVVPGHVVFLFVIHLMKSGHTTLSPIFMGVYLTVALLQVFLLLCIADWMVHFIWSKGKDPDSFSIPYLTALGDLLGTALLAVGFRILWVLGDGDSDVGD
ncbi:solute carrier family 41 member 2-like [Scleropages formosus]|uniref:Solute carrier family 41 member n=1 Tax=Scleropages formosus TaxID=113540 RepID=A0A0P7X2K0_SCLFO|nr:solute carrier family 41 member 2-like [Scleropages formosus]